MSQQSDEAQRAQNISYIKSLTDYSDSTFIGKSNAQIYNMRIRIETSMTNYKKEIITYYQTHPTATPYYTELEIRRMKYRELSNLRNALGLSKRGKKVVDTQPAPDIAEKGRDIIDQTDLATLAAQTIKYSETEIEKERDDFQFITLHEAISMYGDEVTDEFLESIGYKLYEPIGRTKKDEDERYELIAELLEMEITINNQPVTLEHLLRLENEELHYLYYINTKILDDMKKKSPTK